MKMNNDDIVVRYIKTKSKTRKIISYIDDDCDLKKYHRKINLFLQKRYIPSIFSKGYVKGRSIYDNAKAHLYNDFFIKLDIKNFFPNICHKQLAEKLHYEINKLDQDYSQISMNECLEIVEACSINSRGIPLGFITSPILSNIYLNEFDAMFYGYLKKMNLKNVIYTRYADDITVSYKCDKDSDNENVNSAIIHEADKLLSRYGLHLNNHKTKTYSLYISNHVKITGVNIVKENNNYRRLSVGKKIKNSLYWDAINCLSDYTSEKAQEIKGVQSFILSIEKTGYENCFSADMKKYIHDLGFKSLKELIDSL